MTPNVLILDDSLTVRMDLADAFNTAGFHPVLCSTIAEARATLARGPVELAILDVLLPDGDGIDLLDEIRHMPSLAGASILMLSTEAEVSDRIRGLQTGADDYVGKPYDTAHVIARARELLQKRQGTPSGAASATILVVDDSITFREELRRALESAGYSVVTAADGEAGLKAAAAQQPAALVVDGVMPGMDGTTVIRRLRLDAALRGTPCLLLTGSEDRNAELRALDAGADAFVRKDEDLGVILARLAAMLRRSEGGVGGTASLLGPKRILAVDDSITYLEELAAVLRGEGYDAILAHSGEEALEMLSVQTVDCILLDLIMPGLSGQETCRRIKASPTIRDVPLIIISSVEDRRELIDGLSTGADDVIVKSGEFEVLTARIRAQLRRKQFEDEHRKIREDLLRSQLVASEARAERKLAETRAKMIEELERKNDELEAFSSAVSHDLRSPLNAIRGFTETILEDYADKLDGTVKDDLGRVVTAARRMAELIDDLLSLSRVNRADLKRTQVNLSGLAGIVLEELARKEPERRVDADISPDVYAEADSHLMRALLENLLGNAWKFSGKTPSPRIVFGSHEQDGERVYFVRDNGAGFDMTLANKLFTPFQRLHSSAEFPGTGIGLATVRRIVDRHGGRVWAEGAKGQGAAVFFTLAVAEVPNPKGESRN